MGAHFGANDGADGARSKLLGASIGTLPWLSLAGDRCVPHTTAVWVLVLSRTQHWSVGGCNHSFVVGRNVSMCCRP